MWCFAKDVGHNICLEPPCWVQLALNEHFICFCLLNSFVLRVVSIFNMSISPEKIIDAIIVVISVLNAASKTEC